MVVHYVKRKLIRSFCFLISLFGLLFSALQLSGVQKYILNTFSIAEFEKTSGIFPFDFTIYNLKLKIDDIDIFADRIHIKSGTYFNKIKQLNVNAIEIKAPAEEINELDIGEYIPFLAQKLIRKINIEKLIYNENVLKKIDVSVLPKLHSSNIFLELQNNKKLFITTKTIENSIHLRASLDDLSIGSSYNIQTDEIAINLKQKNIELINLHGILRPNSLSGVLTLAKTNQNIVFNSSIEHDIVSIDGYCEYANGISLKSAYDLKTNQLRVHELTIGEKMFIKPFSLSNDLKINELEVLLPKGKVIIENIDLNSESFNLGKWKFENIDISSLQEIEGEKVFGILNGSGHFKNSTEYFDLDLTNIEYGLFKIPSIKLKGEYSKEKLNLKILYHILDKDNSIDVKAISKDWIIDQNTKINISAKGIIDLKDSIKKIKHQKLTGILSYNLNVGGNIAEPIYTGNITINDGLYINKTSGTFIKNGTIKASIKNKEIIIERIYATDDLKTPGEINGNGRGYYQNGEPNIDVNLNIDNFEAATLRDFRGKLFGKIQVHGNLAREIKIKGDLHSNNAKFDISNFVNLANYSLEMLDSIKEKQAPKQKTTPIQIKVPLDINFRFVPDLKIVGFGIKSYWEGGAEIKGDASNPDYKFETKLQKGTIEVAGKKFDLKNGQILCSNKTQGNIDVDVSAVKSVERRKVGARFIQRNNNSEVVFFSKPHTSKNDVLSYMLFDKPSSEISTGEALTLLNIMGKVSGKGGLDIVDKIKTVFGIDSIEIRKHDNQDTGDSYNALSIGKKIGKFKISIDKGADKDTTSIFVETEVAKHTNLKVDMDGRNNFGAGVLWSKRY